MNRVTISLLIMVFCGLLTVGCGIMTGLTFIAGAPVLLSVYWGVVTIINFVSFGVNTSVYFRDKNRKDCL